MLTKFGPAQRALHGAPIARDDLARAIYDRDGVYVGGRRAELDALRAMGGRDPSLGRLYEGHCNGALLVAMYGTDDQRTRARADVRDGVLFGVWNTQDDAEPLEIHAADRGYRLTGAKTWASGAGTVARALVTARREDGGVQMCLVPMDRARCAIDDSAWEPLGMEASNSFRVSFEGVTLGDDDLIGRPGDYSRDPWFFGGALRFVAVHAGIVERLANETFAYLVERGRDTDATQLARAGEMRIAAQSARNWIDAGEAAWVAFDRQPGERAGTHVVDVVDMARLAVERAGLDVIERAVRSVGARGLLEPLPFARLVRDLTMYLRQPAPDAVLARVGRGALLSASV